MPRIDDQRYLSHHQYRTPERLAARAALHARFGIGPQGWWSWVFDQLELRPDQHVLEVGAGSGSLWRANRKQVPEGLTVVVTDVSPGMVDEACTTLAGDARFDFATLDVAAIPFTDATFDAVIANHMLYHAPNVAEAVNELARVLRPGGQLFAATNGENHLRELHELIHIAEPRYSPEAVRNGAFSLENAVDVLKSIGPAQVRPFDNRLWVTETEPLVNYALSLWDTEGWTDAPAVDAMRALVEERIRTDAGIRITKDTGLVVVMKAVDCAPSPTGTMPS
ncbi:MAG: class I SAM-dependent methyltransferase [Ardenticatenales bacterium]|nr:class I SAM-dependent methyltransferase [Ardenticatenales bacterium]